MSQLMNIRQYPSLKGKSKAGGADAQVSTPLMRLKLQTRTIATTLTPASNIESTRSATSEAASGVDGAPTVSAVDERKTSVPQQNDQDAEGTIPKLTLVQMPLLPKPEVARPTPPADPKGVLQRLHDLRTAGDSLLAQTQAKHVPGARSHPGASTSAIPTDKSYLALPFTSNQGSTATITSQEMASRSSCTSSAAIASPYSRNAVLGVGRGGGAGINTGVPQPCLSTPSLVGLRDQEHKDTGGGFLTHFADPRDLCTPSRGVCVGGAAAGGLRAAGATAAGGSTTPLSVLRSIHRLQQLQRLQREGAQLVAAIDASEEAVLGD